MLKIVKIEQGKSSKADDLINGNPREYRKVTLMGARVKKVVDPFTGKETTAIGNIKQTAIVVWKNDHHSIGGKENPNYNFMVKDKVLIGEIVTREVEDYEIPDRVNGGTRTVTKASVPVFADADGKSFGSAVKMAFEARNFTLKVEEVIVPQAIQMVGELDDDKPF